MRFPPPESYTITLLFVLRYLKLRYVDDMGMGVQAGRLSEVGYTNTVYESCVGLPVKTGLIEG